ncbi:E3 ubiquitin-protein ligase RNF14-like [Antedon mediterranea]|uniref:E3 ubiquitin-protein ligase RNF14-like n=1 Tax=Antedon mediterranea TaxID=105859 RepID=UPI003AF69762
MAEQNSVEEQKEELFALQAIFDDGSIVIQNDDPDSGPFSFKFKVPVQLIGTTIQVEVWLPDQVNCNIAKSATAHYKPESLRPDFARTISGHRWHTKFNVSNLTPIEIDMIFPPNYPSEDPPSFKLSCLWLSRQQLSAVCKQLDKLWEEYKEMPVVYTWADWIQHHVLSFLGISETVMIGNFSTNDNNFDERVATGETDCMNEMINILRFNCQCEMKVFLQETHECEVCFDVKPGEEFYRLNSCFHHFCYDCFHDYCELHVTEGTVKALTCPHQECKTPLPPRLLRQVLGDEKYQRWERLLLQKTLESMDDIDWCVRCQMPATKESQVDGASSEKANLAFCTYCFYSYCSQCKDPWHVGTPCKTADEKLQELEEEDKGMTSEELYIKRLQLTQEIQSAEEIKKVSRKCPGCLIPIQKNFGCNHMSCSQCHTSFCWRCGKIIIGYDHFGDGSCILFPGQEEGDYIVPVQRRRIDREYLPGAVAVRDALRNPDNIHLVKRCPTCGQQNLKNNDNNHILCWSCRSHFCFQCLKKIQGKIMDHFRPPSKCQQHSN